MFEVLPLTYTHNNQGERENHWPIAFEDVDGAYVSQIGVKAPSRESAKELTGALNEVVTAHQAKWAQLQPKIK